MDCTCSNPECTQSVIGDTTYCQCVTVINDIACPEGSNPVILENGNCICRSTITIEPTLEKIKTPVSLNDTNYFEDVSWTISYSPYEQKWIGFYSYHPNYYISHQNYFQTGINQTSDNDEFGLWSHLLTNRSYQVFYGKKYPFLVEYMLKREYGDILLKTVGFQMEVVRYHSEFDQAYVDDKTFDKLWIYSPFTNSGELHLVNNTGQLSLISKYPKTSPDGRYQEVLVTKSHNDYTVNYFYNRLISTKLNNPAWIFDNNQIDKVINHNVVKFSGKTVLENMRSNVFTLRLEQSKETRFKYTIDLLSSKTNLEG